MAIQAVAECFRYARTKPPADMVDILLLHLRDEYRLVHQSVVGALAWVAGTRLLRLPRASTGALMVVVVLANTGYLGVPLNGALLGREVSVERDRGKVFHTDRLPWVMPTYHPSALLRAPERVTSGPKSDESRLETRITAGESGLPVMPKGRYAIMARHMPRVGNLGLDMMLRTCTIQVNLDYGSEADMAEKFRVGGAGRARRRPRAAAASRRRSGCGRHGRRTYRAAQPGSGRPGSSGSCRASSLRAPGTP